jgi:hypothetical protein
VTEKKRFYKILHLAVAVAVVVVFAVAVAVVAVVASMEAEHTEHSEDRIILLFIIHILVQRDLRLYF